MAMPFTYLRSPRMVCFRKGRILPLLSGNIPAGADPQGVAVIAASDVDGSGTGIGKKTYSVDFGFGDIDNPFAPFIS